MPKYFSGRIILVFIFVTLVNVHLVSATTLTGTIYDSTLEIETEVIVEIRGEATQQYLSKNGLYEFILSEGDYQLTARKGDVTITEELTVKGEEMVFDIFLLSNLFAEDELWTDTEEELFVEDTKEDEKYALWRYFVAGAFILFALWRFSKIRKKYGGLAKFRKKMKVEHKKSLEEHQKDIDQEPGYLEAVVDVIKKHDGRITQKQLRKEMLHLSEAKISLILTELKHKGKVEKIKKGRGNVVLLK